MKKILLIILISHMAFGLTATAQKVKTNFQRDPGQTLYFLENQGQITDQFFRQRSDIDFKLTATQDLNIFVTSSGLHYQWYEGKTDAELPGAPTTINSYRMDVKLIGASLNAKVIKENGTNYYERYYLSETVSATAHAFQKITYKNVYPNIDWTLYINDDGQLEYDFKVRPGGKVSDIQLEFAGHTSLKISEDGSLISQTPMGSIKEKAPYSFQEDGKEIKSAFLLQDNILSFKTEAHEGMLTIDPTLEWATYYGGPGGDYGRSVSCDDEGGIYLSGSAASAPNIATTGSHQNTFGGGNSDAYLAKFDSTGIRLWATYYGGSGDEQSWSVNANEKGSVYMAGQTSSSNNITLKGFQSAIGGGTDAFLAKFNSDGSLVWATYYGGSANDEGWSVDVDLKGHVYLAGRTYSSNNIATSNVHNSTYDDQGDAFLVKFDTAGNRVWGTYYGGAGVENTWAISCDESGNIYMSGETGSASGIATNGAHQTTMTTSNGAEAFLAKFDTAGKLLWGTYYGGNQSGQVFGSSIACDNANNVYMVGYTTSLVDIATPGSHQAVYGGSYDAFLVKFDSLGKRSWGTYYGGEKSENGYGIACDNQGNVYITGYTNSLQNIATSEAIQGTPTPNSSNEFFVAKFNNMGERKWGTYYGASGYDAGWSLAHDNRGGLYVAGFSNSAGLSTTNGHQTALGGSFDALLFRISECFLDVPINISGPDSVCPNTTVTYKTPLVDGAEAYVWTLPPGWSGSSVSDSIVVITGESGGTISVIAVSSCDTSSSSVKEIVIFDVDRPVINVNGFELGTAQAYDSYQWLFNDEVISGANQSVYQVTENGDYRVAITTENGCIDTSDVYNVRNVTDIDPVNSKGQQVTIYPNPSDETIHIKAPFKVNVTITNLVGKIVKEAERTTFISIAELADGVYMMRITDVNGVVLKAEKIIKQKRS